MTIHRLPAPHPALPVITSEAVWSGQDPTTSPKVCSPGANLAPPDLPRHMPEMVAGLRKSNWGAGDRGREGGVRGGGRGVKGGEKG